jgi:hypothetical protein
MLKKISSKKQYLAFSAILAGLLLTLTLSTHFVTAQNGGGGNNFSGAIYTSLGDGSSVNTNKYASKPEVYLNGGPQNMNANGLPDGTYYFQVTDPSGATLLSSDNAVCRQLQVVNGAVAGAAAAAGACAHANGTFNAANNSTPVRLIPFDDTPNNGGEYKVHLIRQTSQTNIDPNNPKVINFREADSKTDNFKVDKPIIPDCTTAMLKGLKFFDADANGLQGALEPGLAGVQVSISVDGGAPVVVTTIADGSWSYEIPVGSTYKVCENLPITCPADIPGSYWVQTAPAKDSLGEQCYSGTVANCNDIAGLNFGDLSFAPAKGGLTLGFWSNKNGQAVMKSTDNFTSALLFLSGSLCLKDNTGADFNPTTFPQFRTWLLSGNAVNMAYMLSVQLSATSLDVRYSYLNDNTIVDASSLGLGLVKIGTLRNAASTSLCSPNGNLTFTGNPLRQDQEILKNALDAINNNRLPMATSSPAGVCYPPAP